MHMATFFFGRNGWSVPKFPDLDSESTVLFVFGASRFHDDPRRLQELVSSFPKSRIIGCSTAGEIFGSHLQDDSLSVAAVRFERSRVATASQRIESAADSYEGGAVIARALMAPDLVGLFLLSEGVHVNGTHLIEGINSQLPSHVIVTGGLAGDGPNFRRTWVLDKHGPRTGLVSALGIYGSGVRIGHGSKGGWDCFGVERVVTRSHGNILFELDGRPALQLYKEYLGEKSSDLPAAGLLFPLALREDADAKKSLVRTILAIDEKEQSLTFAGDIPRGFRAQLMRANFDRLIEGAGEAAASLKCAKGPSLVLAISCVGRRLILGERTEEELEATLEVVPQGSAQVGFYSYGEFSPYLRGEPCDLHNQTMTLTIISEE